MSRNQPKLKAQPRPLFSCGIFRNCTMSVLSPRTPPSSAASLIQQPSPSPPPPPSAPPAAAAAAAHPPPFTGPSSSSSSSSSSASHSFTQWRFPLHLNHHHQPPPEPEPHRPPYASDLAANLSEAFRTAEIQFSTGESLHALSLLERSLVKADSSPQAPAGVIGGVVAALRETGTARAAAKVLLAMALSEGNRRAAVEAGAVAAAVEAVASAGAGATTVKERSLAALELLCTVEEGAAEVRGHALAATALAGAVEAMAGRGRECAIGVLAAIYGGESASVAPAEVVGAVAAALQGECSARGRRPTMGGGKKKGRGKSRKNPPSEQLLASSYIHEWAFHKDRDSPSPSSAATADFFSPPRPTCPTGHRAVFELHCHSKCSDGFLSPSSVVDRAHRKGVKVLALTDHDTMAGIPEAMEVAQKLGILIIPGVEISSLYSTGAGTEEPVHILAYYGRCGPAKYEELNDLLATIRSGRFLRAKNMLLKLNKLKLPLNWDDIVKIAGDGVAPGRLHVARAMVQAGHVENLKQAFNKYLYDGGPAYAKGSEPSAEAVVELIGNTGGVAALAHPWALKDPAAIIRSLKAAGLHAMEVYRSDGKVDGYGELADLHGLIKLGGSDFHGRGGNDESELGSVNLPLISIYKFLKLARPVWCNATKSILQTFAEEPSSLKLEKITIFGKPDNLKRSLSISRGDQIIDLLLSSWLTNEEMMGPEFDAIRLKLSQTVISDGKFLLPIASQ